MPGPLILIPAAGSASRMRGGDKLLEKVEGQPLLRLLAMRALETGALVAVSLRPDDHARRAALADLAVTVLDVPEASEGMAASLRHGAGHAHTSGASALMVVPGDMPELTRTDLARMLARHGEAPERILRATAADGTQGHPVLFPRDLLAELTDLTGDAGARTVIARHPDRMTRVPLAGRHAVVDLDTPEDWAEWRQRTAMPGNGTHQG